MNRFVSPRLRLVWLYFLIVLPFSTLSYLLTTDIHADIDTANRERTGLQYIAALRHVLDGAIEYRSLAARIANGQPIAEFGDAKKQLQVGIAATNTQDHDLGGLDALKTTRWWLKFRAECTPLSGWDWIKNPELAGSEKGASERVVSHILLLFQHVGDSSKLILDSKLDSYYMMAAVVVDLPKLSSDTAKLRDLALPVSGRHLESPEEHGSVTVGWRGQRDHGGGSP